MPKSKKRILGIDPGTNVLGYAMIDVDGNKLILVEMGVIKMSHLESHQLKLKRIFEKLQSLIKAYGPKEMAVEAPFYGKNPQSMLKLGRAQGVAIAAGITLDVPVKEYAPKKIKQSITGNGNASKEQVAAMLSTLLNQKMEHQYLDATDALAAAVCHHFQSGSLLSGQKRYNDWSSFLNDHPDRLK